VIDSKAKGDRWEREVVALLRSIGHRHVERGYRLGAPTDRGDVNGLPGFLLECKDCRRHELGVWLDEAKREAEPFGVIPALVVKRIRRPTAEAYVVLELATFARLIAQGGNDAA
jgi:hypothetical protein